MTLQSLLDAACSPPPSVVPSRQTHVRLIAAVEQRHDPEDATCRALIACPLLLALVQRPAELQEAALAPKKVLRQDEDHSLQYMQAQTS